MRTIAPYFAAVLGVVSVLSLAADAGAGGKAAPRVYGPSPRVYGPPRAPGEERATVKSRADVTVKVASSTESARATSGIEDVSTSGAKGARTDPGRGDGKGRPVTIYFVHGEDQQSIVEFSLAMGAESASGASGTRAMMFEATKIEADVDGKLLLRGDVRIRFGNGMRLGAQLVSVTVGREEGPVEIVVKE